MQPAVANGGGGVFDGVEQVFPLRSKKLVALGGFLVLFKRHHIDRTHGVESRAHLALSLILGRQFLGKDERNGCAGCHLGHQDRAFDANFVQAGIGQVLEIGLQFGSRSR